MTNMESVHFLNGKLVTEKELLISPRDLGYSRGYAIFDFLTTYQNQRPYMLHKHIDRLFKSADAIALSFPWSKEQISQWVIETLEANQHIPGEKVVRITISGGSSFSLAPAATPTIIIMVDPNIPCSPTDYERGVGVALVEFQRYRAEAKTNNYIEAVRDMRATSIPNIDEIIYYSDNEVREGSRCNVFALINNKLVTPKTNILEGVTRTVLLDILQLPIPVVVEDFSPNALREASEVFITATGKKIMPVTKIDGVLVGDGNVGAITKEVMKQYQSFLDTGSW